MKIKPTRICARKGCSNEFKLYKSTDKYCCASCAFASQNYKPVKKPKPIKQFSEKRRSDSYRYTKKRKRFLLELKSTVCPVAKKVFNEEIEVVEIHHMAGRKGKLLNYIPYWLAVSRKGHEWIHNNPDQAYKHGFLIRSTTVNI